MRPTPAGRGGTARCCSPYNAILERLDTMDVRIQQAVDDANAAVAAATIQAGNAAQSASDALAQAVIAAGKASDAAADAADAAQDAADAAQALSDINDTISTVLNSTLGGKVDKLTTAGLHLYSHTGATQGEEEPIDGTTANSIPIRDGNGRLQATDPASGATDKTLTTANWISQTGSDKPNNLVHDSGTVKRSGAFENQGHNGIVENNIDVTTPGSSTKHGNASIRIWDVNEVAMAWLYPQQYSDGRIGVFLVLRNTDGTSKYINLGVSDVI